MSLLGGIEGGGTKFVCAVANQDLEILAEAVIPTRMPASTLSAVSAFFRAAEAQHGPIASYGLGSFGPLRRHPGHRNFVSIGQTPKHGWSGFPIVRALQDLLGRPLVLDTDVNCALRAEVALGVAQHMRHVVYVTVGTGIGGGIWNEGATYNGMSHPEIGHMLVPRLPGDEAFGGVCPFHAGRCIEGLASGPALAQRLGEPADQCPEDHPIWDLQSRYLGLLCHNLIQSLSPQLIIFGGGVMSRAGLLERIRHWTRESLAGYCASAEILASLDEVIVGSSLKGRAGVLGALLMAREPVAALASIPSMELAK